MNEQNIIRNKLNDDVTETKQASNKVHSIEQSNIRSKVNDQNIARKEGNIGIPVNEDVRKQLKNVGLEQHMSLNKVNIGESQEQDVKRKLKTIGNPLQEQNITRNKLHEQKNVDNCINEQHIKRFVSKEEKVIVHVNGDKLNETSDIVDNPQQRQKPLEGFDDKGSKQKTNLTKKFVSNLFLMAGRSNESIDNVGAPNDSLDTTKTNETCSKNKKKPKNTNKKTPKNKEGKANKIDREVNEDLEGVQPKPKTLSDKVFNKISKSRSDRYLDKNRSETSINQNYDERNSGNETKEDIGTNGNETRACGTMETKSGGNLKKSKSDDIHRGSASNLVKLFNEFKLLKKKKRKRWDVPNEVQSGSSANECTRMRRKQSKEKSTIESEIENDAITKREVNSNNIGVGNGKKDSDSRKNRHIDEIYDKIHKTFDDNDEGSSKRVEEKVTRREMITGGKDKQGDVDIESTEGQTGLCDDINEEDEFEEENDQNRMNTIKRQPELLYNQMKTDAEMSDTRDTIYPNSNLDETPNPNGKQNKVDATKELSQSYSTLHKDSTEKSSSKRTRKNSKDRKSNSNTPYRLSDQMVEEDDLNDEDCGFDSSFHAKLVGNLAPSFSG